MGQYKGYRLLGEVDPDYGRELTRLYDLKDDDFTNAPEYTDIEYLLAMGAFGASSYFEFKCDNLGGLIRTRLNNGATLRPGRSGPIVDLFFSKSAHWLYEKEGAILAFAKHLLHLGPTPTAFLMAQYEEDRNLDWEGRGAANNTTVWFAIMDPSTRSVQVISRQFDLEIQEEGFSDLVHKKPLPQRF